LQRANFGCLACVTLSKGDKNGHYVQRHARRGARRGLLAEELAQQSERGMRGAGRAADGRDRDAELAIPDRPRLALHSGGDHRVPGGSQGRRVRSLAWRGESPYPSVTSLPTVTPRLRSYNLANWYLTVYGNPERSRHLLNCHASSSVSVR